MNNKKTTRKYKLKKKEQNEESIAVDLQIAVWRIRIFM